MGTLPLLRARTGDPNACLELTDEGRAQIRSILSVAVNDALAHVKIAIA
jgi:hypothetical protein